jgi:uncharacterized membrane protein YfcA
MLSALPSFFSEPIGLLLFFAGAVAGGFINGFAGFGTALFTLGFWLSIMPPLQAVSIIVILSVVTGMQGLWIVRKEMAQFPRRALRFVLPGIIGIPLGVSALQAVNVDLLKLVIGLFLLCYGLFFMTRATLPTLKGYYPVLDMTFGLIGGILGGLAALSGALPTFWLSLREWPKREIRAVLQPFNVTILLLTALMFLTQGVYNNSTWLLIFISLPISILSTQIGLTLFKRLKDSHFRHTLIILTFISGVSILASIWS